MRKKVNILMALFVALVMMVSFPSCQQEKSNIVKISGEIENPSSDSVFIQSYESGKKVNIAQAALNEMGHFELEFKMDNATPLSFYDGNESTKMFVFPGDDLHLSLNAKEFDESIKYEGTSAIENNFMVNYYLLYNDSESPNYKEYYSLSRSMNVIEFIVDVEANFVSQNEYIEEQDKISVLNAEFKKYLLNQNVINKMSNSIYVFYRRVEADTMPSIQEAIEELAKEMISTKDVLDKEIDKAAYNNYMQYNIPTAVRKLMDFNYEKIEKEDFDSIYYLELAKVMSQEELNINIFDDLDYRLKSFNANYYETKTYVIENYLKDNALKTQLEKAYQALLKDLEQGYAPGLNMLNYGSDENSDKTLQDILDIYKGKVIYLDIWASWCGPCKKELPYSKKLKAKFAGQDVAFIYLSTDRKLADWENILKLMQLEGEHYRASRGIHKFLATEYNLQYIPHYIIFDKEGKLVKNNAPRPSSAEIEGEIKVLL